MTQVAAPELAELELFRGVTAEQLETVAPCARRERHEAGRLLLRQGDEAASLHLLCSGSVSLELVVPGRAPLVLETLGPGELVGASWLLPPARVHFDVRAREAVESLRFDTGCLQRAMEADPELGYIFCRRFMAVVVRRLQAARVQLMDLYGHPGLFDPQRGRGR